jgi:PAS domain S-box-containing protein
MDLIVPPDTIPILLVDDRPENLLSLEELLSHQGYELTKASSGNEALLLMLRQEFALVLLDVQMPVMDGFETAELMRANPKTRQIPIIFVTAGMKDPGFQFRGYDAGAVDYLAKPIEPLFLQSKVRIFASLYRQRREIEQHKNHLEELVEQRTAELQLSAAELKKSNELLHTSSVNLQTIFDVSPLAIVVSTIPAGILRKVNRTFGEEFGYSEDLVIGKSCAELGIWNDHAERGYFVECIHKQQGVYGFATEIKTFQGVSRSVLLYSTPINFRDEDCALTVFLDVTEQKRMEGQLRQTQKMEVIGQLAGGIAHDFNNMLTAIIGSAELMARHVKDDPAAIKLLGNIQKAAGRSADLTGQLLAFSRKGEKNAVQTCLNTVINEVVALLERTVDKNIILETRLVAKNACVVGDPALLQNALLNLGVNARDAMAEGGVITYSTTNVQLDSGYCGTSAFTITPGPYVEISVSDTGTGMTKEIIQHIFEPFFTTKGIGKGTGLGLAAVYSTVTDHQGCINVYSEPGFGTVFKLYLPLSCEQNTLTVCSEELTNGSGGVLLVDDEEILREVGTALLETLGYQVFLAEDGVQALEIYEQEKENISLVILDMLMPRMGGKETLQRLMEVYPDIRVLISSGFSQEGTVDELIKLGAKGFLQKPYLCQELGRVVAAALK